MLMNKSKLHYTISGTDKQNSLLLIHDNGYSSKIFESDTKFFKNYFKTISIDLAGHGKSGKYIPESGNYWLDNAKKILNLIEKLKINKISIIGTGGGAAIAMHMAILKPTLVKNIIADSPLGLKLDWDYLESLEAFRSNPDEIGKQLFIDANSSKWEKVLTNDTAIQKEFIDNSSHLFDGELSKIECPVLVTGSSTSNLIKNNEDLLRQFDAELKKSYLHKFSSGNHPTIISKNNEFRTVSLNFLME